MNSCTSNLGNIQDQEVSDEDQDQVVIDHVTFISNGGDDKHRVEDTHAQENGATGRPYSRLQAQVVASAMIILYASSGSGSQLISQYLLDRWSSEGDYNRTYSYKQESTCDGNGTHRGMKKDDSLQAKVSTTVMYYSYVSSCPAILSCILFGALVDSIGRRCAIISSLTGSTLKLALLTLITKFDWSINFVYVAFACDGVCGGFVVNLLGVFSLMSDVNREKSSRFLWFAALSFSASATIAVTNVGVGILIQYISYFAASLLILICVGLSLVITVLFLPETLPTAKKKVTFHQMTEAVKLVVYLYTRNGSKRNRCALFMSLLIFFLTAQNLINLNATDVLYQRHQPLCWNAKQIGYYSAWRNGGQYFLGLIYMMIHQQLGCLSDEVMAMVGSLFAAGAFILEAFVASSWQMYLVPVVAIPSSNVAAITRGVMSFLAGPENQGALFSSIAVIEALCSIASTTAYNKVYAATVTFMPGLVYLVMAGVGFLVFLLYIPFFHFYDGPANSYQQLTSDEGENVTHSQPDEDRGIINC